MKLSVATAVAAALSELSVASPVAAVAGDGIQLDPRMVTPYTAWCASAPNADPNVVNDLVGFDIPTSVDWATQLAASHGMKQVSYDDDDLTPEYPSEIFDVNGLNLNDCAGSDENIMLFPIFPDGRLLYQGVNEPGEDWMILTRGGQLCNVITSRGEEEGSYHDCQVSAWGQNMTEPLETEHTSLMVREDNMNVPWEAMCMPIAGADPTQVAIFSGGQIDATLKQAEDNFRGTPAAFRNWPRYIDHINIGVHDCITSKKKIKFFPIYEHQLFYGEGGAAGNCPPHTLPIFANCPPGPDFIVLNSDGVLCNIITNRGMPKDQYQLCMVMDWNQDPFEAHPPAQ